MRTRNNFSLCKDLSISQMYLINYKVLLYERMHSFYLIIVPFCSNLHRTCNECLSLLPFDRCRDTFPIVCLNNDLSVSLLLITFPIKYNFIFHRRIHFRYLIIVFLFLFPLFYFHNSLYRHIVYDHIH